MSENFHGEDPAIARSIAERIKAELRALFAIAPLGRAGIDIVRPLGIDDAAWTQPDTAIIWRALRTVGDETAIPPRRFADTAAALIARVLKAEHLLDETSDRASAEGMRWTLPAIARLFSAMPRDQAQAALPALSEDLWRLIGSPAVNDATPLELPAGAMDEFQARAAADRAMKAYRPSDLEKRIAQENGHPIEEGAEGLRDQIEATIAGRRRNLKWPWSDLSASARALLPGTITLLCGDGGASKSLLLFEAMAYWRRMGLNPANFCCEEAVPYHLQRLLAQADGNGNLTDPSWVELHPDEAREAFARHEALLNDLSQCIHTADETSLTLESIGAWVEQKAQEGADPIIVDPVTAAQASNEPWISDTRFINTVKRIARESGCRLILAMHPRKGRKGAVGLDELAGGAVYARLAQTVLWLDRPDKPRRVRVHGRFGLSDETINRSLKILKTRNGPGAGVEIALNFDAKSLTFCEMGIVAGKARNEEESEIPDPA